MSLLHCSCEVIVVCGGESGWSGTSVQWQRWCRTRELNTNRNLLRTNREKTATHATRDMMHGNVPALNV